MPNDPFEPGLLQRLPEPPRKVALLRASRLGDFICATPAFRALRAALPAAEVTLIALPYAWDLAARSSYLDRFEAFPGFPGMAEQFFEARQAIDFFQRMQAERFDLAVQLHGSGIYANPCALLLGARVTAGFVRAGDPPGRLDAALPLPTCGHEARRTLALATFLGAPDCGDATDYPLWPEDYAAADALLAGCAAPLIGVHPMARETAKCWAAPQFAAAAAEIQRRHGGTVVVLGDRATAEAAREIASGICGPYLDLTGRTPLGALGAVIARLALLITNDSGPAHIAYALGTPSVTIFTATDPAEWGPPWDGPHRALVFSGRDGNSTREPEPAGQVVAAAEALLQTPLTPAQCLSHRAEAVSSAKNSATTGSHTAFQSSTRSSPELDVERNPQGIT